jgi:hypothetical protein
MFKISVYKDGKWEEIDKIEAVDVDNDGNNFLFYGKDGQLLSVYKSGNYLVKIESND